VPGGILSSEKSGNVMQGSAHLGTKVSDMHAVSVLIDAGRARDEKNGKLHQIDAQATGKRAGRRIGIRFVENVRIGNGALLNG
jgi:hypothetical protein